MLKKLSSTRLVVNGIEEPKSRYRESQCERSPEPHNVQGEVKQYRQFAMRLPRLRAVTPVNLPVCVDDFSEIRSLSAKDENPRVGED